MEITVLGTGSAHDPVLTNASVLVRVGGLRLLIDCGFSAVRPVQQVLPDPQAVDGVLITHHHPDHVFGLVPLIDHWSDIGRQKPLLIATTAAGREQIETLMALAFGAQWRPNFRLDWHVVPEKLFLPAQDRQTPTGDAAAASFGDHARSGRQSRAESITGSVAKGAFQDAVLPDAAFPDVAFSDQALPDTAFTDTVPKDMAFADMAPKDTAPKTVAMAASASRGKETRQANPVGGDKTPALAANATGTGVAIAFACTDHLSPNHAIRIDYGGKSFAYSGDGAPTEAASALYHGVDFLMHECFVATPARNVPGHCDLTACLRLKTDCNIARMGLYHIRPEEKDAVARALAGQPDISLPEPFSIIRL